MQDRERRNRPFIGPRATKRSVSFPEEIAAALDRAKDADPRHNFSLLVVEAVIDWLDRKTPTPAVRAHGRLVLNAEEEVAS